MFFNTLYLNPNFHSFFLRCSLLACFFLLLTQNGKAQQDSLFLGLSNWRTKTISIKEAPIRIDTLTILPSTVELQIKGASQKLSKSDYYIENQILVWRNKPRGDSILIKYQVLPVDLAKARNHLDTAWVKLDAADGSAFDFNPFAKESDKVDLIDFNGLDYQGSFSRGVSFGNNQSLVLNSAFNLQLAGNIGDDIELVAAITDQNIPLQPEGNTQQLQEFDRIFIQLKRKKASLIAGDYELARPKSYFMNYFKKLQGATLENEWDVLGGQWKNKGSFAIARGKFSRNNLVVQEGNQGPYQLRGADGERFVIVLAGTEKVYLDGLLLKRGLEQDYVIDYNRGEIVFTPNRIITKDVRIIIEFEYSDQNYLRSLYAASSEFKTKKWDVRFNIYSEQDSKTSSIQQELSVEDRQALRNAGDNIANAFSTGIQDFEDGANRVAYQLRDTSYLVNGNTVLDSALVYEPLLDLAEVTARFSYAGENNGFYIQSFSAANGRVYEWVAPLSDGTLQGDYMPVIRLIAPELKQMYSLAASYSMNKNGKINIEGAFSRKDINRFSPIDDEDDLGGALMLDFVQRFSLSPKVKKLLEAENTDSLQALVKPIYLDLRGNYEFKQDRFEALNPYRKAEFIRDWNINNNQARNEHLGSIGFSLVKPGLGALSYDYGAFIQDSIYGGLEHKVEARLNRGTWKASAVGSWLMAESLVENSTFFRPKVELVKTFSSWKNLKLGVYAEREKNTRTAVTVDTLLNNSFFYDMYRAYAEWPVTKSVRFNIDYRQRYDYAPSGDEFVNNTRSQEVNLNGSWKQKKYSNLKWNFTYRELEVVEESLTNQEAQSTYLGRLDHNLNLWKGAVRSNINYQILSGQEPRREFVYQEVNPGQGVYTWIDYNSDAVQQVNEFEIAPFQDSALYVRVPLFNNEFIRTNKVQYSQILRLSPKQVWRKAESVVKQFLNRFSTQSTVRITRKTQESELIYPWNPFQLEVADTSLVSSAANIRNTIYFNRAHPKYDVQLGMFDNTNRSILTTGYEQRRSLEQFLRARWSMTKKFNIQMLFARGRRESDSELFNNRDYEIAYQKLEPKLTYLFSNSFRTILTYKYEDSSNEIGLNEQSRNHDLGLELTLNQASKSALRLKASYVDIAYEGPGNSPVEFALLNGLKNGQNYLWNLTLDRRLARNILLSITYDGRKTGTAKIIHTGRAQVRATF